MKFIITPDLLTILNVHGDEYTILIHGSEYAMLSNVGLEVANLHLSSYHDKLCRENGWIIFEGCFDQLDVRLEIRNFEKVVAELLRSKIMFIGIMPPWISMWAGLLILNFHQHPSLPET